MHFGLFSNGERSRPIAADTYDEDLYEIQVADELGFSEAWISEHVGRATAMRPDLVSAVEPFIARAAALTTQIRFGPAVRPLPIYQPVQVAIEAAVVDHLTRGRYLFGFGAGGPLDDGIVMRGLGDNSAAVRHARMQEALELILRCWTSEEPFDFHGRYYHGEQIVTMPRPYQRPHPPLAVASYQTLGTVEWAGRAGFIVLVSQYDDAAWVRAKIDAYESAARAAGRDADRSAFRVCRFVYVTDSVAAAREELRPTMAASVEYHKQLYPDHFDHHLPPSGRLEDVTLDHLIDSGAYFAGDPDTVYGLLRDFYAACGGFGTLLLLLGKEWGTRQQRERSLRLFAQHVAPRLAGLDARIEPRSAIRA
jgi:alkanesulfonate monooxygenase SsuD/methylene tetrahydromethanopterin reductase-like flavin-dependent oxidoreductase (luciferase family)